jgi:peptidoglycan/LPS O-acetylase OafA/YrhL
VTESKPKPHRIASLDGLRGISIWTVMVAHISSHFAGSWLHIRRVHSVLAMMAYFGVTVFFVISGFLITSLLIKEHTRSSRIDLGQFYRRRAFRILPASLVYIGIVLALGNATKSQSVYALTFTTSFFFKQAYQPLQQLWSLSVEEQFYLLWPLVLLFGVRSAKRFGLAVMVFCPVLRLFLRSRGYPEIEHLAPAIADSLAAGCLLAVYYDNVRAFVLRYFVSGPRFILLCMASVITSELVFRWNLVVLWGVVPCMIALIISSAIERRDKVLNHGPLVWSGLLSYSLYLWQQPFLVLDGPLNFLSIRLVATFAAAYISYRFVEQPALSVLRRVGSGGSSLTNPIPAGPHPSQLELRGAAVETQQAGPLPT